MNISNLINRLTILFLNIPHKIYNQLTNDSFIILRVNDIKFYKLKYNAYNNTRDIIYNFTETLEQHENYYLFTY